jgi:PAS domain S-box-containing protein
LEGLRMSDTAEWTDQTSGGIADEKSPAATRAVLLSVLLLLVGLGASAWIYFGETRALTRPASPSGTAISPGSERADPVLLKQFPSWILWVVVGTAGGGAACLLATAACLVCSRRAWRKRVQAWDQAWHQTAARLESQLADSRKSEAQLQELRAGAQQRATVLETANTNLQAELDRLKRTGKTLAQQQQALESTKTVLEVHVQARTKELQILQRRYEHILNSAGEGICGLDARGKTTFANPAVAKLTGWTLEELIGKTEHEIFGYNGPDGQAAPSDDHPGERVFHRKDGTACRVEFVKTPIEENGQVVGAVLVFKDITKRKQVEDALTQKAEELTRSNAELEQFAFVASHDLQEPLRKIQAFGDRLKTKCEGAVATEARDYLDRMQNAATRMRGLIDDLLAFSRVIRSGDPFVHVDLALVTKEVLGDLEVRIEKSGAKVEVGPLPVIEADPMQMRQLLLNLIGNSLKFQPAGATPIVKIRSRLIDPDSAVDTAYFKRLSTCADQAQAGQQLCEISVEDNGIGFDEKYSDKIFAVFQRLHGRNEYEGTGVGLAVCRRIADRHHGTIIAKSKPGEGATFIVTLPVCQPKPPMSK